MNQIWIGIIGLVIVFALMFLLNMPIFLAFLVIGILGTVYLKGWHTALSGLATIPYATFQNYYWTVVPLFTLMGFFALESHLAEEFYLGVRKWIGHYKGGLAMAVIIGQTAFGAATGDPVSSAITFTALSLPEMRKFKYDDQLTTGCIASGSLLAGLIPPSMGFILFGALTSTSIGRLFIGGVLPGLLLAACYLVAIAIQVRLKPAMAPLAPAAPMKERWGGITGMWALILIFVIIIGGLYIGLFTPTEAGGVGAFIVMILAFVRRKLSWQGFKNSIVEASKAMGMVGILLAGTLIFSFFMVQCQLPRLLAQSVQNAGLGHWGTLVIILLVNFILGMVMDGLALALLTIPIFFPMAIAAGWDPIHYGIVNMMIGGMGALTPPFAIVVFAISGVAKDVPIGKIYKGTIPFLVAILVAGLLVMLFPQIALWLPNMAMGK